MLNNSEKLNHPTSQEGQQEIKEKDPKIFFLTIIDDETFSWIPHQIVFNHRLFRGKKIICEIFNSYSQDLENYLKDLKEENHFVIVDLSLGNTREGGLGIIKQLNSLGSHAKIFLISGYDVRHKLSPDIKVDRILRKPIGCEEIIENIELFIRKK